MANDFVLLKNYIDPSMCEMFIHAARQMEAFYTEEAIEDHYTYLADIQPHRKSHAYAISLVDTPNLPNIVLDEGHPFQLLHKQVINDMGLVENARCLFNVQEYFGEAEPVPKHCDGELLEFTADKDGNLDIKRAIRPNTVAVLTLVNDSDAGGGTRLHWPDGREEVVRGEAGDLLIFDNNKVFHSVDRLTGVSKRDDGLIRMIIGWRSLDDQCNYFVDGSTRPITAAEARDITETWLEEEWPGQYADIQMRIQKAAF